MDFIESRRREIALWVILSFLFFVHMAVLPLAAGQSSAGSGQASLTRGADNDSGSVEKPGSKAPAKKKSRLLPIIGIALGAGVLAAVLILLVFKKGMYDITGGWNLTMLVNGYTIPAAMTCVGSKKSGAVSYIEGGAPGSGTYTVQSNDDVQVTIHFGPMIEFTLQGKFVDKDNLSGSYSQNSGETGTFTAVRTAAASKLRP